jgi:hypothetical protein
VSPIKLILPKWGLTPIGPSAAGARTSEQVAVARLGLNDLVADGVADEIAERPEP